MFPGSDGDDPLGVVAADLDADGDVDLAIGNGDDGTIGVLLNDGAGAFEGGRGGLAGSHECPHLCSRLFKSRVFSQFLFIQRIILAAEQLFFSCNRMPDKLPLISGHTLIRILFSIAR